MKSAIYWFTNDLRVVDNPLLQQALVEVQALVAVYVVNPNWLKPVRYQMPSMSYGRWQFLRQSLDDLRLALAPLGVELLVLYEAPKNALASLISQVNPDAVYCAEQVGFDERNTLDKLKKAHDDVQFKTNWNDTLLTTEQINELGGIKGSFTSFRKHVESTFNLDELLFNVKPQSLLSVIHPLYLEALESVDLDELDVLFKRGNAISPHLFTGGQTEALRHLYGYFTSQAPATYKQTRNELDGFNHSTKMSPWLALGCLSPRAVWSEKVKFESEYGVNESTYWIGFELLWREYFHWLALKLGAKLFSFKGLAKSAPLTTYSAERFMKWCKGNTPYPLVNACMKQLNATGYMSNRGRQIVASCLVHELAIDWRYGAAYFEQQLLDYDVACNWGNWQYVAGVGVDPRGGRHFNIDKQTAQYDSNFEFIDKWQGRAHLLPLDSVDMVDWPLEA